MTPPPRPVSMPTVTTPKMSSRVARIATSAPLSANAKVPMRSSASRSGVSVDIPRCIPEVMAASQKLADTLLAALPCVRDWQEQFYRDLHRNPELSHQE